MNKEFKAHTELINALKDEIIQLRHSTPNPPPPPPNLHPTLTALQAEHQNIILSLRQEMQELRKTVPAAEQPPHQDISKLITSIAENMVPLITAAVRQGLDTDTSESSKRSRIGTTPTHLRGGDNIQPINLMQSYPPPNNTPPQSPTLFQDNDISIPSTPTTANIQAPFSPPAPSEEMEE